MICAATSGTESIMYCRSFEFAKLVFRIESDLALLDSDATLPFQVEAYSYDYRISVEARNCSFTDFGGCGSLTRKGIELCLCLDQKKYRSISILDVFSFLPMQDLLFEHEMFILHAAFVDHHGEGILFSGVSGVGKSTQAALWAEYAGAKVINGDRTLIFRQGDTYFASGWFQSGTSGICNKGICPIKALVFLGQGSGNHVCQLGGLDRFRQIVSQSSYQVCLQRHLERITHLAASVANSIEVYQYTCTKDENAVTTLKEYLYGN